MSKVVGQNTVMRSGNDGNFMIAGVANSVGELHILDGACFELDSTRAGNVRAIGSAGDGTFIVSNATAKLTDVTLAKDAGSTAVVKFLGGTEIGVNGFVKGAGTATVKADGTTIKAQKSGTVLPAALAAFTIGDKGLTLDSAGYDVTYATNFAGAGGKLVFTGTGTNAYTGIAAASAIDVIGGTANLAGGACDDAVVTVTNATTLSLVNGSADSVSYQGLVLGDDTSAIIAVNPGDVIASATPPVIRNVALVLGAEFADNTYSILRFQGSVSSASLAA